jgi:hypothetical protein
VNVIRFPSPTSARTFREMARARHLEALDAHLEGRRADHESLMRDVEQLERLATTAQRREDALEWQRERARRRAMAKTAERLLALSALSTTEVASDGE